jgi:DNA-binding XRE family transcriptional regulator
VITSPVRAFLRPAAGEITLPRQITEGSAVSTQRVWTNVQQDVPIGLVGAVLEEVRRHPGLARSALRNRLARAAGDAIARALESGAAHERVTVWCDAAGQSRMRPGLYPGPAAAAVGPILPTMRGAELRAARLEAGLRQGELARRIGVSQGMLSLWETGRRPIPPGRVLPIAEAVARAPAASDAA